MSGGLFDTEGNDRNPWLGSSGNFVAGGGGAGRPPTRARQSVTSRSVKLSASPSATGCTSEGTGSRTKVWDPRTRVKETRCADSFKCQLPEPRVRAKTRHILRRFPPEPVPRRETPEGSVWSEGQG